MFDVAMVFGTCSAWEMMWVPIVVMPAVGWAPTEVGATRMPGSSYGPGMDTVTDVSPIKVMKGAVGSAGGRSGAATS